jgi:hypothetical protein
MKTIQTPASSRLHPVTAHPLRVAAYHRTGSPYAASAETLPPDIQAYRDQRGWQLYRVYQDFATAGHAVPRPGLQQLAADVKAGQVDVVLVLRLDRIARNLRSLLQFVRLLREHDVDLISIRENPNPKVISVLGEHEKDIPLQRVIQ